MGRLATCLLILILLGAGALILVPDHAVSAPQATYDLLRWTVDGGGGSLEAGSYKLSATAGQFDAGVLGNGTYTLAGGFWGGFPSPACRIYLPLTIRS